MLVDKTTLTAIINDGIRSLADAVRCVETVGIAVSAGQDTVSLPENFICPLQVKWTPAGGETRELAPIEDPHQATSDGGEVVQYLLTAQRTMRLYDTPLVSGTLQVYYTRYPRLLANDTDVPADIPEEYHEALVSVYARAIYALKMGWLSQYQALAALWENTRKEIAGVVLARQVPVTYTDAVRWEW